MGFYLGYPTKFYPNFSHNNKKMHLFNPYLGTDTMALQYRQSFLLGNKRVYIYNMFFFGLLYYWDFGETVPLCAF